MCSSGPVVREAGSKQRVGERPALWSQLCTSQFPRVRTVKFVPSSIRGCVSARKETDMKVLTMSVCFLRAQYSNDKKGDTKPSIFRGEGHRKLLSGELYCGQMKAQSGAA